MPRYFFHLSFGERRVLDEEGIDLPSRAAARAEATASIRELTNVKIGSDPRRWASWYRGQFLRLPIGYPALEIVRPNTPALHSQQGEVNETRPAATGAATAPIRELRESRQDTHRLLERSRELHSQLLSLGAISEGLTRGARRLVDEARLIRAA